MSSSNPVRRALGRYAREVAPAIDGAAAADGGNSSDAATKAEDSCIYRARCLATILMNPDVLKPPQPLVARVIFPARVTLLAAREKVGKSTLATAVAAAVTRGRPLFGGTGAAPSDVLWINLEEHEPDLVQRLQAFEVDPKRVYLAGLEEIASMAEVEAEASRPGLGLIVIDSLSKIADREGVDEGGNSQKWSLLMSRIAAIARRSNVAVLLLHHMKKDGGYRDSTSIGAGVDIIVEMDDGPVDDPTSRKLRPKGRINVAAFSIRYDPSGPSFALLGGDLTPDARALAYLSANPGLSMSDLAAGIGGKRTTALAIIRSLRDRRAVVNRGTNARPELHVATASQLQDLFSCHPASAPLGGRRNRFRNSSQTVPLRFRLTKFDSRKKTIPPGSP
jgi:hypothetical protein